MQVGTAYPYSARNGIKNAVIHHARLPSFTYIETLTLHCLGEGIVSRPNEMPVGGGGELPGKEAGARKGRGEGKGMVGQLGVSALVARVV